MKMKLNGPGSDLDKDEFCDDCLFLCLSTITAHWLPSNRQSVQMCCAESRVSSVVALSLCSFLVSSTYPTKALLNIGLSHMRSPMTFFLTTAQQPQWAMASSLSRIHDRSQTHHSR
jgi:hypothetical protein